MKPNLIGTALAAAVICTSPVLPQGSKATPVLLTDAEGAALFSKHGGSAKASTRTWKYTHRVMEMTMLQGRTVRTEVFSAAPDKLLVIITVPGIGAQTAGWDGKVGWSMSAETDAALLDSAALAQLKVLADFKPASLDPTKSVPKAESKAYSLGQQIIDGRPARAILRVTPAGDSGIMYFDVKTGLMSGMRVIRAAGQPIDSTALVLYGDYKRIDGVMLPTKTTMYVRDQQVVTRIVEYDHKRIDPAKFTPPPAVLSLLARRP